MFWIRSYTVDATGPLNGQPVSYLKVTDLEELKGKPIRTGTYRVLAENLRGSTYVLKLGGSPCEALVVVTAWMKGVEAGPLGDFGYSVLVEGNGALTDPA